MYSKYLLSWQSVYTLLYLNYCISVTYSRAYYSYMFNYCEGNDLKQQGYALKPLSDSGTIIS